MAGHLLFNSGSNESSLVPQFKWLDNTFKVIFFLFLSLIFPFNLIINTRKERDFPLTTQLMFLGERTISSTSDMYSHGLVNYTDTKMKCRHLKKKCPIKGLCDRCFSELSRLEIQSVVLVFLSQLCELLPL